MKFTEPEIAKIFLLGEVDPKEGDVGRKVTIKSDLQKKGADNLVGSISSWSDNYVDVKFLRGTYTKAYYIAAKYLDDKWLDPVSVPKMNLMWMLF